MSYRPLFVIAIFTLALHGCGSSRPSSETRQKAANESASTAPAPGEIRLSQEQVEVNHLQVREVIEGSVSPTLVAVGRVRVPAGSEAEVFAPFPGRLLGENPLPKVGDSVAKGQTIADVEQQFVASEKLQIATTAIQLRSEAQQDQQELDLKWTELDRAKQLYDGGAISLKQLQAAEFDVKQAETKLDSARRSIAEYDAAQSSVSSEPRRALIVAPISGTVLAADATLGQQIDSSKKILTIADLRTVWVEAAVHERDLSTVRRAKQAEISFPAANGNPLTGHLITIENLVDPQNRTVPMIFAVSNPDSLLKIDMFVEARIPTGIPTKALLIPSSSVLSDENSSSVYVEVQPGVFRVRVVQLGPRTDSMVAVTSGLTKGEKVVAIGAQSLLSESRKSEIPVEEDDKPKKEK